MTSGPWRWCQCRRYAIRAGFEATLSVNVRAHGLRHSRYRAWPAPTSSRTRRRTTRFHALCAGTA
ncbi:hypothetical protein ACH4UM_29545 [Streptomyces sp. NPDC020801]|uniref:hypothetical protein n=1 Tax=unclassified Streptomyces TaxID=2593676 RepID=UPI00378BAEF8